MKRTLAAWLQALRLKFYPMSWVAFTLGAVLAAGTAAFAAPALWTGLAFVFFLEVATVLGNEYFDLATDSANLRAGPFNGGSRVLVDGLLSQAQIKAGIAIALGLALLAAVAVLFTTGGTPAASAVLMAVLSVLALGYTAPPLQLSYRTLGELDVAITDSIGVLLCGYVLMGGNWHDAHPWWLSLPLGLAFLPSITLCAVPDVDADRLAGKRSIAERFGVRAALRFAQATAVLAALGAIWLETRVLPGSFGPLVWLGLLHAAGLVWLLQDRVNRNRDSDPVNSLMVASLTFVTWFGVLPLVMLLMQGSSMR